MQVEEINQSVTFVNYHLIKKLYDYNDSFKSNFENELSRNTKDAKDNRVWDDRNQKLMMQAMYDITFLCLLRMNEILRIQYHHIRIIDEEIEKIEFTLSFRKIHQLKNM